MIDKVLGYLEREKKEIKEAIEYLDSIGYSSNEICEHYDYYLLWCLYTKYDTFLDYVKHIINDL